MNLIFFSFFEDPIFSLSVIFVYVITCSFLMYLHYRRQSGDRKIYLKKAAFIAEICTVVGLVGIFTLAGRMTLEQNNYEAEERYREIEFSDFPKILKMSDFFCKNYKNNMAPTKRNINFRDVCENLRKLNLQSKNKNFNDLKNILNKIYKDSFYFENELRFTHGKYIIYLDRLISADSKVADISDLRTYIKKSAYWWVWIMLAFVSLFGVSLKCARAFGEMRLEMEIQFKINESNKKSGLHTA